MSDAFASVAVDFHVLLLADERIVLRLDLLAAKLELEIVYTLSRAFAVRTVLLCFDTCTFVVRTS